PSPPQGVSAAKARPTASPSKFTTKTRRSRRGTMLRVLSALRVLVVKSKFKEGLAGDGTHLRRAQGHRLRQLYRRAGGGDGDVGFWRRSHQDRAARHGRPVSPPRNPEPEEPAQSRLFL